MRLYGHIIKLPSFKRNSNMKYNTTPDINFLIRSEVCWSTLTVFSEQLPNQDHIAHIRLPSKQRQQKMFPRSEIQVAGRCISPIYMTYIRSLFCEGVWSHFWTAWNSRVTLSARPPSDSHVLTCPPPPLRHTLFCLTSSLALGFIWQHLLFISPDPLPDWTLKSELGASDNSFLLHSFHMLRLHPSPPSLAFSFIFTLLPASKCKSKRARWKSLILPVIQMPQDDGHLGDGII